MPEKSAQIRYLKGEIRKLAEVCVDDISELENIVSLESCNYRNNFELETEALKEDIALVMPYFMILQLIQGGVFFHVKGGVHKAGVAKIGCEGEI